MSVQVSDFDRFSFTLFVALVIYIASVNLLKSRTGRAMMAP